MPEPRTTLENILTLSEAASLLRVEETPLVELAARGAVPAQKIGEEWRFSKAALVHWLHFGPNFQEMIRFVPHLWPLEFLLVEKLFSLLEQRLLDRPEMTHPQPHTPGSKRAVRKHVGVFESDGDMEEVLAGLSAIREGKAGEGGG